MKKSLVIVVILLFFVPFFVFSQEIKDTDKVSTVNVMISTIYSTRLGMIIEFYADGKFKEIYLPHNFFENRTVVKVLEDNPNISPQMNIIYKNNEPFKIKLYMPTSPNGWDYQVIQNLPDNMAQIFTNTKKLEIISKTDESTPVKK